MVNPRLLASISTQELGRRDWLSARYDSPDSEVLSRCGPFGRLIPTFHAELPVASTEAAQVSLVVELAASRIAVDNVLANRN